MASTHATPSLPSPPDSSSEAVVEVYALRAGRLTLPERFFVYPASQTARRTVPSLAFLIVHQDPDSDRKTRIVFDLGIRRDPTRYPAPIRKHLETRIPLETLPDVTQSLAVGGLTPDDIDFVIYSHVHWDHVGEPRDFPKSTFVVGHGALAVLDGSAALIGGHSHFEADLLPAERTIELSDPSQGPGQGRQHRAQPRNDLDLDQPWKPHGCLPKVLDIFRDGSLYIVDAPGHLPGHINLLARTSPNARIYMAGDACHDRRILDKQKQIGQWLDDQGCTCCIHSDKKSAEETIERIHQLDADGVEVILAHDVEWEQDAKNHPRFYGGK